MVVHTPSKLEVLRQTAAQRRAGTDGDVPPSVAAATAAAAASATAQTSAAADGDFLGGFDTEEADQDFAAWNGVNPPCAV